MDQTKRKMPEYIKEERKKALIGLFRMSKGKIRSNIQAMEIFYIMQKTGMLEKKLYDDFSFNGGTGLMAISWSLLEDFNKMIHADYSIERALSIPEEVKPELKKLLRMGEIELADICTYLHYLHPREKRVKDSYGYAQKYLGIDNKELDYIRGIVTSLKKNKRRVRKTYSVY